MITYRAMLDVPRHVADHLSRLLAARRRRVGTPRRSRALGTFRQAVLVLRWFRQRSCVHCLAADFAISQATAYRYLYEGISVLAAQAPDLHDALDAARMAGIGHVILDGTLIETDRVAGVTGDGNDAWHSGKHKAFGANVQFLAGPDGDLLWVSDAEPGSTHDITAAQIHALPALYPAAANGLPTLADSGYQGARIGIHTPIKHRPGPPLDPDNQTYNALHRATRTLGEQTAAILKQRFRTLGHITLSPSRIGDIARATLTLHHTWERGRENLTVRRSLVRQWCEYTAENLLSSRPCRCSLSTRRHRTVVARSVEIEIFTPCSEQAVCSDASTQ